MAGSLATGLVAAVLFVVAPFIPAEESAVTGAVLCGFALGWAMLAVLSVRLTDQPQRWAAAPALFLGLCGLLLLVFGSEVHGVLAWVWPPALVALVSGWSAERVAGFQSKQAMVAVSGVRAHGGGRDRWRLRNGE